MPIGIDSSRSSVPDERSRSVVTEVTRNITMNGNSASSGGPRLSEHGVVAVEHPPQQREQHARDDEQHRHRAVVAAQLGEHPAGHGERDRAVSCTATSCSRIVVDEGQERALDVVGAGRVAQPLRGVVGQQLARRAAAAAGRSGRPRP